VRFALTGSGSLPARDLDFAGTANLIGSASDPNSSFELPFVVQGPWQSPLIMPDPQTLIRRSGATAPLIDALQDRKTRDAVRAAIEKLTGAAGVRDPAH
jgi:AsmA protein